MQKKNYCCRIAIQKRFFLCVYGVGACSGGDVVVVVVVVVLVVLVGYWRWCSGCSSGGDSLCSGGSCNSCRNDIVQVVVLGVGLLWWWLWCWTREKQQQQILTPPHHRYQHHKYANIKKR